MAASVLLLHFDLMIRPEKNNGVFAVSLWATRGSSLRQRLYVAPPASWFEYSRRLEEVKLLDAHKLGLADACVARGETVVQQVQCSHRDLEMMGFEQSKAKLSLQKRMISLRNLHTVAPKLKELDNKQGSGSLTKPSQADLPVSVLGKKLGKQVHCASIIDAEEANLTSTEQPVPSLPKKRLLLDADGYRQKAALKSAPNAIALLGVRINNLSMDETVDMIDGFIEDRRFHQIATANLDFLNKAFDDPKLLEILQQCDLVLADGMPLVWASRLMGVPLKERVTGSDLLPRLLELSARKKRRIFLLGATEERSRAAVERISRDYPGAVICGRHSPVLAPLDQMAHDEILEEIHRSKPDVLLVAFGNPKQEKWLAAHRDRLNVPVCIGVGASIDFLSGKQSRAPIWMQRSGLEWVHRVYREPRRLALRYLNNALFLSRYLSVQLLANSLQTKSSEQTAVSIVWHVDVVSIEIVGAFSGDAVQKLLQELEVFSYDSSVILNLISTSFIAPDASGLIVHLSHQCAKQGKELWIAGGNRTVRAALRATFPAGEPFQTSLTMNDALRFASPASLAN